MTTILILISRPDWLDKIFATLEMMDCDADNTNILGIVDGDASLYMMARNKINASRFDQKLCVQYQSKEKMLNANIAHRQKRIADIHNYAKQFFLSTDYIFGIEDDSSFSPRALKILQHDYMLYPYAGIISGVELGRHGIYHIGAWKLDDIYNPSEIKSIEKEQGVVEVDATGMYCFLTKADNYMRHTFEPYENTLGPDFNFGLSMRQSGLMNYVDFNVPVDHQTKRETISMNNKVIQSVSFIKVENRWRQKTIA